MAAFSSSGFDASAYFKIRPRYNSDVFSILYAWHQQGQVRGDEQHSLWEDAVDLGTGPGQLAYQLQSHFRQVIGIDPSPQMLKLARSLDAPTALHIQPAPAQHTISFQEGHAEKTGLADESTDLVTAGATAHWLDWYGQEGGVNVWNEMARILRPRGTLAFIGYSGFYIRGMNRMNQALTESLLAPDRLGNFFETSNPKAPVMVNSSYYDLIPKPTGEKWEESLLLKFDVDTNLDRFTSEPEPLPSWVGEAMNVGSKTSLPSPLSIRQPLKALIRMIRSVSGYVKYLEQYPEQKELISKDEDKAFEWCEEARWVQAHADAAIQLGKEESKVTREEAKACLVSWDQEVEVS